MLQFVGRAPDSGHHTFVRSSFYRGAGSGDWSEMDIEHLGAMRHPNRTTPQAPLL